MGYERYKSRGDWARANYGVVVISSPKLGWNEKASISSPTVCPAPQQLLEEAELVKVRLRQPIKLDF
jgi:hypothetical protein